MPTPVVIHDPDSELRPKPRALINFANDAVATSLESFMSLSGATTTRTDTSRAIPFNHNMTGTTDMDDISTSPRLLGYVFSCISSVVSMISSTIFYRRGITEVSPSGLDDYGDSIGAQFTAEELAKVEDRLEDMTETYHLFFGRGGIIVQRWKLFGSIAISGLLTFITLLVVIAHFDSICCPKKFRIFFRDGSKGERSLIFALIMLSVVALHTSTSKFSVGEAQANVYFSTWTNFASCVANYEVWRKGSGRNHTFQNIIFDTDIQMKRYWLMISITSTITFLSTLDYFVNNNFIEDRQNLDCLDIGWANLWIWVSLASVVLCWGVLLVHRYLHAEMIMRIMEIFVALAHIGGYGLVIARATGGRLDQVTCPSNLYFGMWATFFTSVWIFSSTIRKFGKAYFLGDPTIL
ncbi:hypothetical protein ACHAXS_009829 [Conticribra weissflogii]